jgi:DNA mismatch repair protein MutL
VDDVKQQDMRERLASFFRTAYTQTPAGQVAISGEVGSAMQTDSHRDPAVGPAINVPRCGPYVDRHSEGNESVYGAEAHDNVQVPPAGKIESAEPRTNFTTADPTSAPISPRRSNSALQLHNSYLVTETDDGLLIIDQHALHERIMYEELWARVQRGPLESQRLLIPDVIPASARQISLLDHIQPLLTKLGIELSAFGPDSVAIQAFPSFLEKLDPGQFVRDLLERGEQELLDLHPEEILHELLDMMACKAAVKAGEPLTAQEIESLIARRDLVERSSNCPHGRPTTLRLTLRDLEKQFKRTGF